MNELIQNTREYGEHAREFNALNQYIINLKTNGVEDISSCVGISRNISAIFDKKFEVSVVDTESLTEFFGVNVFPSKDAINMIGSRFAENRDYGLEELYDITEHSDWRVELDSKLLNDKNLNATVEEIIALILHEIFNSVFGATPLIRLRNSFIAKKENMNLRFKTIARHNESIFANIFTLPVAYAYTVKNFGIRIFESELATDKAVVDFGYGKYLERIVGKMISAYGISGSDINRTEEDCENDVGSIFNWIINNLNTRYIKQQQLIIAIRSEVKKTRSLVMRDVLTSIIPQALMVNHLHDNKLDYYERTIMEERWNKTADSYTTEGLLSIFDKDKRVRTVKYEDIDYIKLNVDRIQNHDDRIFVLDLIYDQLDIIEASEDLIASGKANLVKMKPNDIKELKNELNNLRKQVLSMKIDERSKSILIRYPKGYEG